jgi:aquaglyceroporin related protein
MADEQPREANAGGDETRRSSEAQESAIDDSRDVETPTAGRDRSTASDRERGTTSSDKERSTTPFRPGNLRRSSTAGAARPKDWEGGEVSRSRPRGSTLSSRPRNLDSSTLSPTSLDRRNLPRSSQEGESLRDIPEEGIGGTRTSSTGVRPRLSSAGRPRRGTLTRQASIGASSGRAPSIPGGFSLAGVQEVSPPNQHQPYVDPRYTELNPAYEQPVNNRPVWGLAKPLPRVVRPGMVPTPSELSREDEPVDERPAPGEGANDVEKGYNEPISKLRRTSTMLQAERQRRENRVLQRFGSTTSGIAPFSRDSRVNTSRIESEVFSPQEEVIQEEDLGLARPGKTDDGGAQSPTYPFPDDAASQVTQIEDDEWMNETEPIKPYGWDDEVHNHHTRWSVVRTKFREPLAELLAVRFHRRHFRSRKRN